MEKFRLGPERAIKVDLDGKIVQITSSTIQPQMLREMKGAMESGLRGGDPPVEV